MMEDPVLLGATVVAASTLYVLLGAVRGYLESKKPLPDVPMGPGSNWLVGHVFQLLQDDFREVIKSAKASANEQGQVAFWAIRRRLLCVFDLKDAKTILNKEHYRFRPGLVNRHVARVSGERGLLALNGKDWKLHRSAVTRTFNPEFLGSARMGMKEVTETMVKSIQRQISASNTNTLQLDIEPLMKLVTLGIFGKTALNVDLECCSGLTASPLAEAFDYCIEQFMIRMRSPFKPAHLFYWIPTEQNVKQLEKHALVRSFLTDLIEKKRSQQNGETGKDLLSHLVKAHNDVQDLGIAGTSRVTDEHLTDIVMSLFVAGFDTTSITLACTLYLLAQHPEAERHCVNEISRTEGGLVDPEDLVYCRAVIWESLRMYPPAVMTLRTLTKPVTLSGGLVVPEGTDVTVPIYSIQHDEKIFPKPNQFCPDRWVAQDERGLWVERDAGDDTGSIPAGDRSAMLAFSAGGRNCVGMKFAMQEAVITLSNLLKGLKFEVVPGFEMKTSTKAFLHKPCNGVLLNVSARADVSN